MAREVGDWTREKLRILALYLAGYLQATSKTRERIYIDAFAGPGKNQLRRSRQIIDGSPLIALQSRARNGTRFSRLFFIEQDEGVANQLSAYVKELDTNEACEVIPGDVNVELPRLVRRLSPFSPVFVLLDTEGIEPKWSTIEAIASWQVEFLINFPLGMSINRNLDSKKTLDYFGTPDCLPLLTTGSPGRARALLDLYKERLASLGLVHSPEHDRLVRTDGNTPLYYLLLASKVKAAKTIMDWVFRQPDATGQGRFQL